MRLLLSLLAVLYLAGFLFVLWIHTQMPVTLGLALVRAAAWPVWITVGWPHGESLPMD